jgi:hypothetical protein
MKAPKSSQLEDQREFADEIIFEAMKRIEDAGIPFGILLDRMATAMAAQSCIQFGSAYTATQFREMADRIAAGTFAKVAGEERKH